MNSKLRWIPLTLIVVSLLASCHPRIDIVIMTPTQISAARVTPVRGQILPSSVTPDPKPMRSATATPAPTDIPPTAIPTTAIPATATPAPTLAPASNPTPTAVPIPTSSATPTSTPTPKSGVVVTTPTPVPPANPAPSASSFDVTPGVALRVPRADHSATRLADGKILLVGGSQDGGWGLADVEIFDPATGQTSRAASLHTAQHNHTATLLPDGRVLVVGGYSGGWLNDAEVYDPATDTWTVVPPRYSHAIRSSGTLMKDGRVLVVGGGIASSTTTERVDIFDPKTNVWTEAQPLKSDRASHTAALLNDGRVLVAGGISANDRGSRPAGGDAWLYDPQTDTWTATGPMVTPRLDSASVRLPDGRVLVSGGFTYEDPVPKIWASTEIYDPASNTWTAAANLAQARYTHALVLLPDGQVLAVGGARDADYLWNGNSFVREIERYDPAANEWRIVGELPEPRAFATATLLPDGRVWLAGGRNDTTSFSDTWLIGAHVE